VAKYEIWGDDEAGRHLLLGYNNGELPQAADTMVVRGQVRDVEKVWRHHVGTVVTQRVRVGRMLGTPEELEKGPAG
jgi:hypothetical protein